jgi:hypothetical protein
MKLTHIHLFLILLAALVLCSFLGGVGCTREGMEDGSDDAEDNGDDNEDNENETNNDEEVKIVLVNKNGKVSGSIQDNNYDNYYSGSGSVNTYYGPYGNKVVAVKGPYGNEILVDADYNQNTNYSQTTTTSNNASSTTYSNDNGSVTATTGPQGNTLVTTSNNNGALVSTNGVKQIPPGDEDLYILKSQIVPPVCPACPGITPASLNGNDDVDVGDTSNTTTTITGPRGNSVSKTTSTSGNGNGRCSSCNDKKQCPPCPSCARCPEPSFDCKKVPSYKQGSSNAYLPRPVLSDFSTFGM